MKELSLTEELRGKRKCYENGTIVAYKGQNKVTYYLLTLSELDEDNRAQASKESNVDCLNKLLDLENVDI